MCLKNVELQAKRGKIMSSLTPTNAFPNPPAPIPRPPGRAGRSTPRRSSSRSIKRKKFDDELVESSLKKVSKQRGDVVVLEKEIQKRTLPTGKGSSRKQRKSKTNDLTAVYLGIKFSCRFTPKEIQERWYQLLYDPVVSRLATTAVKQLPPDVIAAAQNNALWNKEEELILANVPANSPASLELFQDLLDKNPSVFHQCRSAKALRNHWLLMRQYQLLSDQTVSTAEHAVSFSDAEEQINDAELSETKDDNLEQELSLADRRNKREIRMLEGEIPLWQVIVEKLNAATGATTVTPASEFDSHTLAVLRGRLVRYLMRSREIIVGRSTADNHVDVDLSLEGPAWKISRRQAVIKLRSDGEYCVINEGRRPLYIDGKPVVIGAKARLHHNSTFEICGLRFVFLINQDLPGATKEVKQPTPAQQGKVA
ncbi:hypothetical protein pdam_00011619 [Pocillopora damicornis]|uniref:FHA domain-containing protein n=1 Tax=Pocillopora damicornis TaxID=46731 RepID=A0A3M6TLW4_POCDA|nr:hypothetical protein pdam_00011619 [Pocillopora damicornis]